MEMFNQPLSVTPLGIPKKMYFLNIKTCEILVKYDFSLFNLIVRIYEYTYEHFKQLAVLSLYQ